MNKHFVNYFEGKNNSSNQKELFQRIDVDEDLRKEFISFQNNIGIV